MKSLRLLQFLHPLVILFILTVSSQNVLADNEFTGSLQKNLIPKDYDLDDTFLRPANIANLKFEKSPAADAYVTIGKLDNPTKDEAKITGVLVEEKGQSPIFYFDTNGDLLFSENEMTRFEKKPDGDSFVWTTIAKIPINHSFFAHYPVYVSYFPNTIYGDEMTENDRLILYSSEAFARGEIDVKGKKTAVVYQFRRISHRIVPTDGWLGIDSDGNGEVDTTDFSPEAANADEEIVVFRVGQTYLSPKKVDLDKNLIVWRENSQKDYKRAELRVGEQLPDFSFVDLDGNKRKFSEFKGKFVLLDFWGTWCPPCRRELPYLKAAAKNFKERNFEIIGMNVDPMPPSALAPAFKKAGIDWTQAGMESIIPVLKSYRVDSFPTTILIDPTGKIISLNQTSKGQPSLRGRKLLDNLDEILPSK